MSPAPIILLAVALTAAWFLFFAQHNNAIVPLLIMAFGVLAAAITSRPNKRGRH